MNWWRKSCWKLKIDLWILNRVGCYVFFNSILHILKLSGEGDTTYNDGWSLSGGNTNRIMKISSLQDIMDNHVEAPKQPKKILIIYTNPTPPPEYSYFILITSCKLIKRYIRKLYFSSISYNILKDMHILLI